MEKLKYSKRISKTKLVLLYMTEELQTDVLVIGGGIAGSRASIEASKQGVDVLLVTKGIFGRSCSSVCAVYYMVPFQYSKDDSFDKQSRDILTRVGFLHNQDAHKAAYSAGPEFARELEELGLYWRRYDDGELVQGGAYDKKDRGKIIKQRNLYGPRTDTGRTITNLLAKEVRRRSIKVIEDSIATHLLTEDGKVVGATALDYRNGRFLVLKAKSTILACSDSGFLWKYYSGGSREITGDGPMMAYRAGAELVNVEINLWHYFDLARPVGRKPNALSVKCPVWCGPQPKNDKTVWSSVLRDSNGDAYLSKHEISGWGKSTLLKAALDLIGQGKATQEGGMYGDLRHVSTDDLDFWPQKDLFNKMGINTTKDLIEIGFTAHQSEGGVRTNERMETGVPGLYAAGATAFQGNNMHVCLYNGRTAGRFASDRAKKVNMPNGDPQQIDEERNRVFSQLKTEPKDGPVPSQIKRKIREIMWNNYGPIKNKEKMTEGLKLLRKIKEDDLPNMHLNHCTRRFSSMWAEALEVHNMLEMAEIIIKSGLLRKESRSYFFRSDYPQTDKVPRMIVLRLMNGRMQWRYEPVELKYWKAE